MSPHEYYSDRILGPAPLDQPDLGITFWKGFIALITRLIDAAYFAEDFPEHCEDSPIPIGTSYRVLGDTFVGHIPGLSWPLDSESLPTDTLSIFDAIEFFYRHVSKPTQISHHTHFRHNHILKFDRELGRDEYHSEIDSLFRRNRHPYELTEEGQVQRIGPPVLDNILYSAHFCTGDGHLDNLLETARIKYLDPDIAVRKEALEKLWDAWERTKTLRGSDKKSSINQILKEVSSEDNFQELLNKEALEVTEIGNNFMIRHTETNKIPIANSEQIDYLFHRLFCLIWHILRKLNLAR